MSDLNGPYTYSSPLGSGGCPAGTFHFDIVTQALDWSDGLYALHGYERGEVVPTVELLASHKHPDDKVHHAEVVAHVLRTGGPFCTYHRIIDARGRVRRVLSSGEGITDADGKVVAVHGLMVDFTSTLQRETEQIARDAVAAATATRSTIDQARGILMGRLLIGSEAAFRLLVSHSSHRNRKLSAVAAALVQLAAESEGPAELDALIREMQSHVKSARKIPRAQRH